MKKFIYSISIFFMFLLLLFYLMTSYPSIEILPKKYSLHKTKSFLLWTHRATIFKFDTKIDLINIDNYPNSQELEKKGYHSQVWFSLNEEGKKTTVIKYLNFLSEKCMCDTTDVSELITDLKHNKDLFLFSKIGLFYGGKKENGIGLSYFYFINKQTKTLYAFEIQPNM